MRPLLLAYAAILLGALLFMHGFLLNKVELDTRSRCADYPTPWNSSFLVRTYQAFKLTLDQDNAPQFEFYELCVKKDAPGVEAAVQAIDPSLVCGVAGVLAGCDAETEVGCHGDLEFVAGGKALPPAKWAQLKALSLLDAVTRLAGGYWL